MKPLDFPCDMPRGADPQAPAAAAPAGSPCPPVPAALPDIIADEIARRPSWDLRFSPPIEARFEIETKADRVRTIRLTVPVGLIAYIAFTLVDGSILPDLGGLPELLRLGAVLPIGLFAMWMADRASARFREGFISFGVTCAVAVTVWFITVSRAPLAPYTMLTVLLISMFGTITLRVRFRLACYFTAATAMAVALMLAIRSDLPNGLPATLFLAITVCAAFGLIANYQLERAERTAFLLAFRERLRADQLSKDKAAFSRMSRADFMTGLFNRRAFDERLAELWRLSRSGEQPFALLMIDVDYFKRYNDFYGHQAGDDCLSKVAKLLSASIVRKQDLVARYGGEEFAVLLANCDAANAKRTAERLCRRISGAAIPHANRADGVAILTASIGLAATDSTDCPTPKDIVEAADIRLYAAKASGRNQVASDERTFFAA